MNFYLAIAAFFLGLSMAWSSSATVEKDIYKGTGTDFTVEVEVYLPTTRSAIDRTVVIYPPTGGANRIDRSYARQLADKGATALVLTSWTGLEQKSLELTIHQTLHEKALKAFEVVVEKIPQHHKVSVVGTSVGGLFASIIAAKYDRPDTVLVIAAGAPIPEVIAESDQSAMVEYREKRMKEYGFHSKQEYADAIKEVFFLDPLSFNQGFQTKRLGLVILNEDSTVPTKHQRNLLSHWNTPHVIERNNSHLWGIIYTWWHDSDRIINFALNGVF